MAIILDQKVKVTKKGKSFYYTDLLRALVEAQYYAQNGGHVASMPELLRGRVISPADNELWTKYFTALSEENVGRTPAGSAVLVTVHGGGVLSTPERIAKEYKEQSMLPCVAKFTAQEFKDVVEGKLPDGTQLPVYSFSDLKKGVKDLPLRCAVVMDFETAQKTYPGYQLIDKLYDNPLVIVRAGGVEQAKAFLDKAKRVYDSKKLGNWHRFGDVDIEQSQGRLLFLGHVEDIGLDGYSHLYYGGRFFGVAPEVLAQVSVRKVPRGNVESARASARTGPTIDELLADAKDFVAPAAWAAFEEKVRARYQ
ncbi:hypothetical protein HZB03_05390 [Candidatus Woesearchaeota archaeon]|nr:hypothetical protein [Candidatus Woesearchaeota archaeon]